MFTSLTSDFIEDFFPDVSKVITILADHNDVSLVSCIVPEPTVLFMDFVIRNPSLLPIQIAGLLIGLAGTFNIRKSPSWKFAFLYFALMNLASILCHNIAEKYTQIWHVGRVMDIVFTGSSSVCLAVLVESKIESNKFILLLAVIGIYGTAGALVPIPFASSIIYILLMIIATLALLPEILLCNLNKERWRQAIALYGLGIILLSLGVDWAFCFVEGWWSAVHAVFLGSDIIFLGLLIMGLEKVVDEKASSKKTQ